MDSPFGAAKAAGAGEKPDAPNLESLFSKIVQKQASIKNHRMMDFIRSSVPYGVDPSIPMFGEYETFRSDKSANFMNDGAGHIVYRQYRRARLSDILHNVNRRTNGGF
ncbi:unnamed protein product [Caenorhabditis angaria]|uniref:Uncharacterized protein n=1 Tax=Caenorhabditis angaria TaxID=860376 RepID=A0A9P1IDP2_9PELO|nr:unnamed protein product [Caenorhabditis angaria]